VPRLTYEAFRATMPNPVARGLAESAPFDFWPYFDTIVASDFEGHDCSAGNVSSVYRDASGRWEHVLIGSEDRNTFMVVVLDLVAQSVHGHHLLDLNRLYGISPPGHQ
jgi:hypothetical protein